MSLSVDESLLIDRENRRVAHHNLAGSSAALNNMIECQKAQYRVQKAADPFKAAAD